MAASLITGSFNRIDMNRRKLLLASGVALSIGVSGCSSDVSDDENGGANGDGNGDEDGSTTGDENGEENGTEISEEELVSAYEIEADVPTEVSVGDRIQYSVTVSNNGEGTGEAQYGLEISTSNTNYSESAFEQTISLESGESETTESDPFSFTDAQTIEWRFWVDGPDNSDQATYETVIEAPDPSFGDSYRTPTDLVITAENPRTADRYEYENWTGEIETHRAEAGEQFAFVDITISNESDETRRSPNRLTFELIAGGELHDPMSRIEYEREDGYDGLNDLPSGVSEDGVLPYLIPSNIDVSDLELYHTDIDYEADAEWEVRWD